MPMNPAQPVTSTGASRSTFIARPATFESQAIHARACPSRRPLVAFHGIIAAEVEHARILRGFAGILPAATRWRTPRERGCNRRSDACASAEHRDGQRRQRRIGRRHSRRAPLVARRHRPCARDRRRHPRATGRSSRSTGSRKAGFVALLDLHPGLRRVVPVAMRHWRHHPFVASTWREVGAFRDSLQRDEYAVVLDLQEQIKGALIARMARGVRHGPDRASIREPLATLLHDVHHADRSRSAFHRALPRARCRFARLSRRRPASIRTRRTGAAAAASFPTGRSSCSFTARRARTSCGPTPTGGAWSRPSRRPAIRSCCHGEATTSAPGASNTPPAWPMRTCRRRRALSLPSLASLLARAELAVGVDTGLVHLAAALGTPTVSLFVATDPMRCGVGLAGPSARDLGGIGSIPAPEAVERAAGELMRRSPRC